MLTAAGQPEWRKEFGNARKHTHLHVRGPGDSFTCWPLTEQGIITGCTINARIQWWPCSKTTVCWRHSEDGLLGNKKQVIFILSRHRSQSWHINLAWVNSRICRRNDATGLKKWTQAYSVFHLCTKKNHFLYANKPKKKVDEVFRCESHRSSPATLGEGGRVREAAKWNATTWWCCFFFKTLQMLHIQPWIIAGLWCDGPLLTLTSDLTLSIQVAQA